MSTHPTLDDPTWREPWMLPHQIPTYAQRKAVFDQTHRVCESCGGAMPSRMSRQRNEKGSLVCDSCKTKSAPAWKSAHASTLLIVSPESRAEFFRREAEAVSSILRIERMKDAVDAYVLGTADFAPGTQVELKDGDPEAGLRGVVVEPPPEMGFFDGEVLVKWQGDSEPYRREKTFTLTKVGSSFRFAHDMGDGGVVNHCPFCGSGAVVGGSDGTVECGFCHTVFSVQVQPSNPSMPQTVNGQPFVAPGMPAGEPTEMSEPKDPVAEQADQQEGEDPSGAQQPKQPGHPSDGDPNPSSKDMITDRQQNPPHEKAKVEDAAKGLPGAKPSDPNVNPFAKGGDPDKAQPGAKGDPAKGAPPVDKAVDKSVDKPVDNAGDTPLDPTAPVLYVPEDAPAGQRPTKVDQATDTPKDTGGDKTKDLPPWMKKKKAASAVLGSFSTADGPLAGEAYMKRLALQFADDRSAVLSEIRSEAADPIDAKVDAFFVEHAHQPALMRSKAMEILRQTDRAPRTPEVKEQRELANAVLRRLNGSLRSEAADAPYWESESSTPEQRAKWRKEFYTDRLNVTYTDGSPVKPGDRIRFHQAPGGVLETPSTSDWKYGTAVLIDSPEPGIKEMVMRGDGPGPFGEQSPLYNLYSHVIERA